MGVFHGDGHGRKGEVEITADKYEWAEVIADLCCDLLIPARIRRVNDGEYHRVSFYGPYTKPLVKLKTGGLWKMPTNLHIWSWLSGLIDTDGSVHKSANQIRISQKANGNLDFAAEILKNASVPFTRSTLRRKKYGKWRHEETLYLGAKAIPVLNRIELRHPDKKQRLSAIRERLGL